MCNEQDSSWLTDESIDTKPWSHISKPNYKSINKLVKYLEGFVRKWRRFYLIVF